MAHLKGAYPVDSKGLTKKHASFDVIRPRAISLNKKHHDPCAVERTRELRTEEGGKESKRKGTEKAPETGEDAVAALAASAENGAYEASKAHLDSQNVSEKILEKTDENNEGDSEGNGIWCALVFRMICWLLLHNFDKMDKQISKSESIGSRLPVYIM